MQRVQHSIYYTRYIKYMIISIMYNMCNIKHIEHWTPSCHVQLKKYVFACPIMVIIEETDYIYIIIILLLLEGFQIKCN